MTTAASPHEYPNAAWGQPRDDRNGAWNGPWSGNGPGAGHWSDQYWHNGFPGWGMNRAWRIVAVVLGFMLFWPVGLGLLIFMLATGRLGRRSWCGPNGAQGANMGAPPWAGWCGNGGRRNQGFKPSGNHAFDEYRAETLRRLEEEQNDFAAFLERLRFAKDKAEFDQFMADRRQPRPPTTPEPPAQG